MIEYLYRMRNVTKSTYEYIWLPSTDPEPTVLPDNPEDQCDQSATIIEDKRGEGKQIALAWGFDGIYGHSGTSYVSFAFNCLIPLISDLGNYTKIDAKYVIDYETEGTATIDVELYNYTNSLPVPDSEENFPNQTWGAGSSEWVDVTSCAGCSIRLRSKRVGGAGSNDVKIEAGTLILKFS